MIGPSEATIDDGVDCGNGEADRAFVFHHNDVVEVEFRLGDVSKANESGIGFDWSGAGDMDRIAGVVIIC